MIRWLHTAFHFWTAHWHEIDQRWVETVSHDAYGKPVIGKRKTGNLSRCCKCGKKSEPYVMGALD